MQIGELKIALRALDAEHFAGRRVAMLLDGGDLLDDRLTVARSDLIRHPVVDVFLDEVSLGTPPPSLSLSHDFLFLSFSSRSHRTPHSTTPMLPACRLDSEVVHAS